MNDKAVQPAVEAFPAHFIVNLPPHFFPLLDRTVHAMAFDALDRAVQGNPGHCLGVSELPRLPALLPDAGIGLLPYLPQVIDKFMLHIQIASVAHSVALLGLSFKLNTDDLRESPNVELAE